MNFRIWSARNFKVRKFRARNCSVWKSREWKFECQKIECNRNFPFFPGHEKATWGLILPGSHQQARSRNDSVLRPIVWRESRPECEMGPLKWSRLRFRLSRIPKILHDLCLYCELQRPLTNRMDWTWCILRWRGCNYCFAELECRGICFTRIIYLART